jgi:hypothetical protein
VAVLAAYYLNQPALIVSISLDVHDEPNAMVIKKNLFLELVRGEYTQDGEFNGKPKYVKKGNALVTLKCYDKHNNTWRWSFMYGEKVVFYSDSNNHIPNRLEFKYIDDNTVSAIVVRAFHERMQLY